MDYILPIVLAPLSRKPGSADQTSHVGYPCIEVRFFAIRLQFGVLLAALTGVCPQGSQDHLVLIPLCASLSDELIHGRLYFCPFSQRTTKTFKVVIPTLPPPDMRAPVSPTGSKIRSESMASVQVRHGHILSLPLPHTVRTETHQHPNHHRHWLVCALSYPIPRWCLAYTGDASHLTQLAHAPCATTVSRPLRLSIHPSSSRLGSQDNDGLRCPKSLSLPDVLTTTRYMLDSGPYKGELEITSVGFSLALCCEAR